MECNKIKNLAKEAEFDSIEAFTSYCCPSDYGLTEHCEESKSCLDCWKLAEREDDCYEQRAFVQRSDKKERRKGTT